MATTKAKSKARRARKPAAKPASNAAQKLGKYMEDIRIGNYTWDDVLNSTSKNMEAVAEANRAIIEGYTQIARRQYQMLKGLLRELRKVRGDRDDVVRELKRVIERARKDVRTLQKMASSTNSKAQRIVTRRVEANLNAWKLLAAEVRKSVGANTPAAPIAMTKAAPKRKAATKKKKAAPKKKAGARRKAAKR